VHPAGPPDPLLDQRPPVAPAAPPANPTERRTVPWLSESAPLSHGTVRSQHAPDSTLAAFAARRAEVVALCGDVEAEFTRVIAAVLAAVRDSHPQLGPDIVAARESGERLRRAFCDHWGADPDGSSTPDQSETWTLGDWGQAALAMIGDVQRAYVPMRALKRQQARYRAAERISRHLALRPMVEFRAVSEAYNAYRDSLPRSVGRAAAGLTGRMASAARRIVLPPGVGGLDDRRILTDPPVPGVGPLAIRVGNLDRRSGALPIVEPTDSYYRSTDGPTIELPLPSTPLPLILDLDRQGGFATDSAGTAVSVLLRLLALLPPGRVKAHVYDPQALGDNVKLLFGLGDVASRIIGNKVRTDPRELAELLSEVEEHLTFVTQKYLGGSYDSLTAYNAAAGEVAEPYRLLLFFDFPKGFRRADGSLDDEALDRLGKIVQVGPRCGVFTVVVGARISDLAVAPFLARGMPVLLVGDEVPPNTGRLLTGLSGTALTQDWPDLSGAPLSNAITGMVEGTLPFLRSLTVASVFVPEPPSDPEVVAALLAQIERGLTTSDDVRVDAESLHRLATTRMRRAVERGVRRPEVVPAPMDSGTWWRSDSGAGITTTFARVGAADVGELTFASEFPSALLGGRPGAGKSVLLHAMIGSLVRRYGPDQLELYMIDLREGVEFQVYAAGALPHARVVAVESDREFALSVLRSIDIEIGRRGEILRATGGEQVELMGYRQRTGLPMPRVLVVIDEFHVLFNTDDAIATEASQLLDRVIRQGRGFGIHALLASQTLDGMIALGKHTLRQVPVRIALQSDEADSRIVLGEDNPDARLLTRSGEGILNRRGGLKDANERFQAVFSSSTERERLVAELRTLADSRGFTGRPVVFESRRTVDVDGATAVAVRSAVTASAVAVPVGLPMTLGGPVAAQLRREAGGHLLLVAEDNRAHPVLAMAIAAGRAGGAAVHILDMAPAGAGWPDTLEVLAPLGGPVSLTRRNGFVDRLREVAALVRERTERSDLRAAPVLLVIAGLHRARDLDPEDYDDDGPQRLLNRIVVDGPDVGVHVVAWSDKRVGVERRVSREVLREFTLRLVGRMSAEDSRILVDTDTAATLSAEQLLLDDQDRGEQHRVRAYGAPRTAWWATTLDTVGGAL
jgi:hypothetical protein